VPGHIRPEPGFFLKRHTCRFLIQNISMVFAIKGCLSQIQSPQMENLQSLETNVLIDLLAEHTARYTQLLADGGSNEEYEKFKLTIEAIIKEIELRKQSFDNNATTSVPPPDFTL
jgi:hypothetical protein